MWNGSPQGQVTVGEELEETQHGQVQELFKDFADVLRNHPDRTELVEHQIDT